MQILSRSFAHNAALVASRPGVSASRAKSAPAGSGTRPALNRQIRPAASLSYRIRSTLPELPEDNHSVPFVGQHEPLAQRTAPLQAAAADAGASSKGLGRVAFSVLAASMAAFSFGYALSVVNGPLDAIAADLGFAGDANLQGLVVSTVLVGASLGSMSGSAIADGLGRKNGLLSAAVPLLAGALLCAQASSFNLMAAGRFLTGLGIGLASALVPVYISEVAPTTLRGVFGTINQLAICIGILGGLVANVMLPATSWRVMFNYGAIPAVLLALGMLFSPESPRYLAGKGRPKEAAAAAMDLWGSTEEIAGEAPPEGGPEKAAGLGELLSTKGVRVGMMMFVFQQFSGINAIIYFSTSVFQQAGVASVAVASAAVGACNVLGTIIAGSAIEKAGRKQLLLVSYAGMGLSMLAMAAGLGIESLKPVSGPVALVGTLAYILSFALGAGPVAGLLVPEITGPRIRGSAMSLAMVTHWVCNVMIGQFFLSAVAAVGVSGVYCGFGAVCAAALVFIQGQVVETKGKSTEEIIAQMG